MRFLGHLIDGSTGGKHLSMDRGMLRIKQAKDRYTLLSERALRLIEEYTELQKLKPGAWLFSGQQAGRHLSVRSTEKIFLKALDRTESKK